MKHHPSIPLRSHLGGFTLLELLLVIVIISLIVGTMATTLTNLEREYLEQGSDRLGTGIRQARVDAAMVAKRLRMVFDEEGKARMEIEREPLKAPNVWEAYHTIWADSLPNDMVRVAACELTDEGRYIPTELGSGSMAEPTLRNPIIFYPDGSFDSSKLEITSTYEKETRRGLMHIDGLNTQIRTYFLTPSEYKREIEAAEEARRANNGY